MFFVPGAADRGVETSITEVAFISILFETRVYPFILANWTHTHPLTLEADVGASDASFIYQEIFHKITEAATQFFVFLLSWGPLWIDILRGHQGRSVVKLGGFILATYFKTLDRVLAMLVVEATKRACIPFAHVLFHNDTLIDHWIHKNLGHF